MEIFAKEYKEILRQYLLKQSEQYLYTGQQLSRLFIEKDVKPEEVIGIHKSSIEQMYPDDPEKLMLSFDFLLEVMVRYGLALQERKILLKVQDEMQKEIELASKVQETMLETKIPHLRGLDIGVVSVPSKDMNGDYVYFNSVGEHHAEVAVADVIGRGIPAALCMSMIKFSMDSFKPNSVDPVYTIGMLNRIVEKNLNDSMFVSMFYGRIDIEKSLFTYASAGHEPAIHYKLESDEFEYLSAKGLLLGVEKIVSYEQKEVKLNSGDLIVIYTDGVTESRSKNGFITQESLQSLFREYRDLSAQKIADSVFRSLENYQECNSKDDVTIVVLKKE